jgi:hemerythrin superfamily protein
MDAITLLKDDHRDVEKLFKRFEKTGERAHAEQREIVGRIIESLSIHAAIEEQLFYPVTRATVPEAEDDVLEAVEEHHIVKWTLSELEDLDPADERFRAKVTVLIENVRHHVHEEEDDYFPKVRAELGRKALGELGDAMVEAKKTAPTHPHPRSPDTPPGNVVAGNTAGVVDRMTDTVTGLATGGVSVVADLIARLTGGERPSISPTGPAGARRTARKVRTKADDAVDHAQRTGQATVKAAAKGAKDTATTARKAADKTARTASRSAAR